MDYINCNKYVDVLEKYIKILEGKNLGALVPTVEACIALALDEAHDDVAPVVHGKWTEDDACPYCGCYVPTDDAHDAIFKSEAHYCYYCGAKMDLRADEGVGPYKGEADDER